jgi:hypothetical protein
MSMLFRWQGIPEGICTCEAQQLEHHQSCLIKAVVQRHVPFVKADPLQVLCVVCALSVLPPLPLLLLLLLLLLAPGVYAS